jgi:SAM-dependent methyltransferase
MKSTLAASASSRCFLCGAVSDRVVWRENGFDGRLCGCGILYTDTRGHSPESLVDLTHDLHPESFYSLPARTKAKWVAAHCPPGKLLEVGCGDGFFLAAARDVGYEVAGMEPHACRAGRTSRRVSITIERTFIEQDSLPPASYDVVYQCDLLAHFPDPIQALRSTVRLLRPGGVLCFETGILGDMSPVWYRLIGGIDLGPHLWLYSDAAVAKLLDHAGLLVEHRKRFSLVPQLLLTHPLGLVTNRLIRPVLSALRLLGFPTDPEKAHRLKLVIENFLRYHGGPLPLHFGPATLLIVARPKEGNVPS